MQSALKAIVLVLLFNQSCLAQSKRFGTYYNKWRYWGPIIVLNKDSTFQYYLYTNAGEVTTVRDGPMGGTISETDNNYFFVDSSYGRYYTAGDTVFFSYSTEQIKGDFNGYNDRVTKMYWRRKSLHYIHRLTGAVLRQKEYYLVWRKGPAPRRTRR